MDRLRPACETEMKTAYRKILDKSFTYVAYASLAVIALAILTFLAPIVYRGVGAVIFNATVEHEKFLIENLGRSPTKSDEERIKLSNEARAPLYEMMGKYESPSDTAFDAKINTAFDAAFESMKKHSQELLSSLELKGAERGKRIAQISEKIWADYIGEIDKASSDAKKDGTSFALIKVLKGQDERLADAVRREVAYLNSIKKLNFMQKSLIRRNASAGIKKHIDAVVSELDEQNAAYKTFKEGIVKLLGQPDIKSKDAVNLLRQKYGQTRMDMARSALEDSVLTISVKAKDSGGAEYIKRVKTAEFFKGTKVGEMAEYIEENFDAMLQPHMTAYWGFFFDEPFDSNIFGGIWPMILGTFYLTLGSMIIAAPLGIAASIYFSEYSKGGKSVELLRICVGTLAGVPSIVFGLFGLAFLINTVKISEGKSVLAGCITLALLILPTIIRSCEESLKAVPNSYREAALSLGANKWKAIRTVILPAALPSMLTGIIISMGRAAGETAPIIFTAATSTGAALAISEIFTQPTPALPWNIYNICSEHEMAERVSHVQYGMVLTLIGIVLLLNAIAIVIRARLQNRAKH